MAGYQEQLEDLDDLDVAVVALSVDSEDDAAGTVEKLDLEFPVLYDMDPTDAADRFGAYVHPRGYLQPVGFLVRSSDIEQVTYSSGPLGRLRPEEVRKWVEHVRSSSDG